jgi:hypothetical protein
MTLLLRHFAAVLFWFLSIARFCILVELTDPFEDRVSAAAELKCAKYYVLRQQLISNGYDCSLFNVKWAVGESAPRPCGFVSLSWA